MYAYVQITYTEAVLETRSAWRVQFIVMEGVKRERWGVSTFDDDALVDIVTHLKPYVVRQLMAQDADLFFRLSAAVLEPRLIASLRGSRGSEVYQELYRNTRYLAFHGVVDPDRLAGLSPTPLCKDKARVRLALHMRNPGDWELTPQMFAAFAVHMGEAHRASAGWWAEDEMRVTRLACSGAWSAGASTLVAIGMLAGAPPDVLHTATASIIFSMYRAWETSDTSFEHPDLMRDMQTAVLVSEPAQSMYARLSDWMGALEGLIPRKMCTSSVMREAIVIAYMAIKRNSSFDLSWCTQKAREVLSNYAEALVRELALSCIDPSCVLDSPGGMLAHIIRHMREECTITHELARWLVIMAPEHRDKMTGVLPPFKELFGSSPETAPCPLEFHVYTIEKCHALKSVLPWISVVQSKRSVYRYERVLRVIADASVCTDVPEELLCELARITCSCYRRQFHSERVDALAGINSLEKAVVYSADAQVRVETGKHTLQRTAHNIETLRAAFRRGYFSLFSQLFVLLFDGTGSSLRDHAYDTLAALVSTREKESFERVPDLAWHSPFLHLAPNDDACDKERVACLEFLLTRCSSESTPFTRKRTMQALTLRRGRSRMHAIHPDLFMFRREQGKPYLLQFLDKILQHEDRTRMCVHPSVLRCAMVADAVYGGDHNSQATRYVLDRYPGLIRDQRSLTCSVVNRARWTVLNSTEHAELMVSKNECVTLWDVLSKVLLPCAEEAGVLTARKMGDIFRVCCEMADLSAADKCCAAYFTLRDGQKQDRLCDGHRALVNTIVSKVVRQGTRAFREA